MPDPNTTNTNSTPVVTPPIDDSTSMPMPSFMSDTNTTDSGSSAPNVSFPDLKVEEPKKKFGGGKGKIIATILGIVMLVGGVGTGVYLALQNQNPNEQAAGTTSCGDITSASTCTGACSPTKADGQSWKCKWLSATSKCTESNTPCGGSSGTTPDTISCPAGSSSIPANGTYYSYCGGCISKCVRDDLLINKGCNIYVSEQCGTPIVYGALKCNTSTPIAGGQPCTCNTQTVYFDKTGLCDHTSSAGQKDGLCAMYPGCLAASATPGAGVTDTWSCDANGCKITSGTNCAVRRYTCNGSITTQSCLDSPEGPAQSFTFSSSLCGKTQQIDVSCGSTHKDFVSKIFPACSTPTPKPPAPTPKPTPSPSPTPVPVAQCQNVTAYSSTWSVLSATQLSQLKSGSVVNFCVVGSATAGSFDKAMFNINGTGQPETTLHRPNTQDFCQAYTIPAGTYKFNITAQIHHVTLGWK